MFSTIKTKKNRPSYLPLPKDSTDGESCKEQDSTLESQDVFCASHLRPHRHRIWCSSMPWIIMTFTLLTYIITTTSYYRKSAVDDDKWNTDFKPFRPLIQEYIKTMSNGLDYKTHNGTLGPTTTDGDKYWGTPSAEIDAAWDEIAWSKF
jgi:hypothetical protein